MEIQFFFGGSETSNQACLALLDRFYLLCMTKLVLEFDLSFCVRNIPDVGIFCLILEPALKLVADWYLIQQVTTVDLDDPLARITIRIRPRFDPD